MTRPRILLTPTLCELEWRIKPQIEEWAEVASYDAPGVGAEKDASFSQEAIAERGLVELDRLGWERCVVVGDEFGCITAARIAAARPDVVEGLVLGHATLSLSSRGERPPLNPEMLEAFIRVARTDYGSHVRSLSQITQHAYDDEFADAYRDAVPPEVASAYTEVLFAADEEEPLETFLRRLDVPLLFVEHKGCLLYTPEGFEDAVAAFPRARRSSMDVKPSANPKFAELLKAFCAGLPASQREAPTGIEPV
jgi:pimeloyl-ACP methyl ester carboxylesterase